MKDDKIKKTGSIKLIITLLTLGACWSIVYIIPFLQYVWYDPFQEFLGSSNTQMGLLITIYGFGNVFGAPVGGWVADRFNYKIVYVLSVLLNGVFSLGFVLYPSYGFAILMWIGFAIASLFMNYPTHIKIVRNLTTDENQGKIFGFNETCIGIFNIVFNMIMMFFYVKFMEGVSGMKAAIVSIVVLSFILTIIAWFVLDNPVKKEKDKSEKTNIIKDFKEIGGNPATWLVAISIFAVYSFLTTMSYFTPYFTDVLGVTVVFTGWIAILRQHGMTLLGAPIGGFLTDKIGSPSKVLMGVYVVGFLGLVYLLIATNVTAAIIIVLTVILSAGVYIGRGAYYATITECGISRDKTASTIGVAAAVGFSPDLFQFVLFGHWLDKYGNTAYSYMFIFQAIVLVIGFVAAVLILRLKKKNQQLQVAAGNK
ncbi:MFS transporter [Abyssisolibacter fermentans]|uniref:MFS transporter n=1 Tax=Abyssisolibacter fermentans TaxID=1766203 RepID=UPI000832123B|nr:MFS transporter [Abyssisolibacter fermentans]